MLRLHGTIYMVLISGWLTFAQDLELDCVADPSICDAIDGAVCENGVCVCVGLYDYDYYNDYSGWICETDCNLTPCENGGSCVIETNTCQCPTGFSGLLCERGGNPGECTTIQNNCSPNATCTVSSINEVICTCNTGYTGDGYICTEVLYSSCLEVYQNIDDVTDDMYLLKTESGQTYRVYCDFSTTHIYTFIARTNLTTINIGNLFNNYTEIVVRHKRFDNTQHEVRYGQINRYNDTDISVQYNSTNGYADLINPSLYPYVYVGLIPVNGTEHLLDIQGYSVNGQDNTFVNCDGNPNSYFAVLFNRDGQRYGNKTEINVDFMTKWKTNATQVSPDLPDEFFAPFEMHHGGCGGYITPEHVPDVIGVSFGLRYDLDPCSTNPCGQNGSCTITGDTYICACSIGFVNDGNSCIDIDECFSSPCDFNANCTNTEGNFECQCLTGYSGDGVTCFDIDECLSPPCDINATCTNTIGSFECSCLPGFSGDGTLCVDINECLSSPCDSNATCRNTGGSFNCTCLPGFFGDGLTCSDIDECSSSPCDTNATCTNTEGSFECNCLPGFNGSGLACFDINECITSPCGSNAICRNTVGSFNCDCLPGFSGDVPGIPSDGLNCFDIDECSSSPCDTNATCTNTEGSFECDCLPGFNGSGLACFDINECLSRPCHSNATCRNTDGSFDCNCLPGFSGDGLTCIDEDECLSNLCDRNANCTNTEGSFECRCLAGFTGNGFTCLDLDECALPLCDINANCTNTEGSFHCECLPGFSGFGYICSDINECLSSPCDQNANCMNTNGSFICRCDDGFSGSGLDCIDINECFTSPCDQNANCTNTNGSFVCSCDNGFSGSGLDCTDINECSLRPCDQNANCINTDGSFNCRCSSGFNGDGVDCTDINECLSSPCDQNANCSNTNGSFVCSCDNGFSGSGLDCTDINECSSRPCDQKANCINTDGSFECRCTSGFSGNGFNCTDDDECLSSPCHMNADCFNTEGSFNCTCSSGYSGDGRDCTDIDECIFISCDLNANCTNTDGSFVCGCNIGYTGNGTVCYDVDECVSNPCDSNAICSNTDGSYACQCNQGYTGNGTVCVDIDECISSPCDPKATCLNTDGSFTCACLAGYSGNGTSCSDINECLFNPCDNNADCTNTDGSFICQCRNGYTGNGTICSDIDECSSDPCDINAVCTNSDGSFTCQCNSGFIGNGTFCSDIDECPSNPCDRNADCTNMDGSFTCQCKSGFSGNGTFCSDFNECSTNPCDTNADCTNTDGSFTCQCKTGFTGNGTFCSDNDECFTNPCDTNADCTNTDGSFTCECNSGFTGNGTMCSDIDECITTPCDLKANCSNTAGSFTCQCHSGFTGNGTFCSDIDECSATPCDSNADCANTEGSFTCQCHSGFTGNGTFCSDVNECSLKPCDTNADCTNTDGSFTCQCKTGFTGNGTFCIDINECMSNPCDPKASCTNTNGSFTCQCDTGFTGNGTFCSDIDECSTSPCDPKADCSNTDGSFSCQCKSGFSGNGTFCSDTDECASSPCDQNAVCTNTAGSFLCECKTGHTGNGTFCTDINECPSNPCDPKADCTNTDGSFQCNCVSGYTGNGTFCTDVDECSSSSPCSADATCTNTDGSFSCSCVEGFNGDGLTCSVVDCGQTPDISNGSIQLDVLSVSTFNSTATVTCEDGFEASVTTLTCLGSGNWDKTPICSKVDCGQTLPLLDNGMIQLVSADTNFGAAATVVCDTGYITDKLTLLCLSTGQWDENIQCVLKDCGIPNGTDNGVVIFTSTTFGSPVTYRCNTGYELQGTSSGVCQDNTTWSITPPTCIIKDCGDLSDIPNGQVNTNSGTQFGDEAVYTCNEGYTLIGEPGRICGATGEWIGEPPTCQLTVVPITKCDQVQDPVYNVIWNTQQVGQTSQKPCPPDFTGTVTKDCTEGGIWAETSYNCIRQAVIVVSEKATQLDQNSSTAEITDTINELTNIVNTTVENGTFGGEAEFTESELTSLADTLDTVANVIDSKKLTDEITDNFLEVASDLIDEDNSDRWRKTENGAEKVLSAVDSFASSLSGQLSTSNQTRTVIAKQNLVLEVKKVPQSTDFIFPNVNDPGGYTEEWVTQTSSGLQLKAQTLQANTSYITSTSIYRNVSEILPARQLQSNSTNTTVQEINGPVIALSIDPPITVLDPPVILTFQHTENRSTDASCNFWTFAENGSGFWSTDGCRVVLSNDTHTQCECDHLTNFAVLMSPFTAADANSLPLRIISIVGISISILGLVITVFLHLWLWRYVKNDRVVILINLCIALTLSYVIFIGGVDRTESRESCAAVAAMLQYIYLVVFFSMLAEGIEICSSVVFVFSKKSKVKILLLGAWFLPGVIVGISLGVTKARGYGNEDFCWLSMSSGLIWAFVGPALAIIIFNCVCLIIVLRAMFTTQAMAQKKKTDKLKTSVRSLCVLMPLMGVTWLIGIFHINDSFYWIQYMFAILNGLQGFFIFLIHCVFNQQIKRAFAARKRRKSSTTFSTSMSKKMSQSKRVNENKVSRDSKSLSVSEEKPALNNDVKVLQNSIVKEKDSDYTKPFGSSYNGNLRRSSAFSTNQLDSGIGGGSSNSHRPLRRNGIDFTNNLHKSKL